MNLAGLEAVQARTGLLLVNLGTPDAPEPAAVRRYLDEFLSDPRVVEIPRVVWKPILKLFVLTARPAKSAANYAKVWNKEAAESPLKHYTRLQASALQETFGPNVHVDFAMRYGYPSIAARLKALRDQGCQRLLIAPLYPQYSSSTTGTVLQRVFEELGKERLIPALRTLPPYYDHPDYIEALKASLEIALSNLSFAPERILLSFHGLPKRTVELGDPYYHQCLETARLLREATGYDEGAMPVAFQSRFGKAEWLQPYAEPLLQEMAEGGVRRVAVMTPGFSVDCVETLEEIAIGARETFLEAGGTDFAAIPCLNDSAEGMAMLEKLMSEALAGFVAAD